ncbi:hypothetical protein [Streptococcus oricebi]|uniref:Uncharacterized protein n=1 Tax=Streptococcus oricebi TaxID=1547447 RepID=A0ABS5B536_9STRE|nr:hypothetical protein [Streptococcus oricebi]MBP2623948.1 hypothetical protein [Streptococcus oricebi]
MVENIEDPIGTLIFFGGLFLLVLLYGFLKALLLHRRARRKARQRREDDLVLAYLAWVQEQEQEARRARIAQARKQATPSFQDFDLSHLHS